MAGRWRTLALGVGLASVVGASAQAQDGGEAPVYRDTGFSFDERAADLVSRMTLDEKAYQLATTNAPAIPRLGVQEYSYFNEAQHGVAALNGDYASDQPVFTTPATSFPTNLSMSLTWDPALVRRETSAISDEARAVLDQARYGQEGNNLGPTPGAYGSLTYWAPTVNLDRDPRWGRTDEAFGEDPFLVGTLGSAWVNGFQGQTASGRLKGRYLKAVATAKHFALNNVEDKRTAISSDTDEGTIRDYYTPQFRRLVEDAHVGGLMSAYNAINGTPAVANSLTMNVLAHRTWGFTGYVTSDCGAVATTYRSRNVPIGVPFPVGIPLVFYGHDWAPPGWTSTKTSEATRWVKDGSLTQVSGQAGGQAWSLRAGTQLNCFGANGTVGHPTTGDIGRTFTGQENDPRYIREAIAAGILSEGVIDRALQRVFTIRMRTGEFDPVADQPYTRISGSEVESEAHKDLAQDVAAQTLTLLENARPRGARTRLLPVDPAAVRKVVVLGDQAGKAFLGGYSGVPEEQTSLREGVTAFLRDANPGAEVVYDDGGSSTTATEPASLEPETKAAIRDADLVLVMVGTDTGVNAEGTDRKTLAMPGNYESLVDQAAALGNPRIALLVQAGSVLDLQGVRDDVAAILFSGPNGQRQGAAAAEVVFGEVNPAGRLSFTWYRDESQLPDIQDYDLQPSRTGGLGRTYQYFTGKPTYPFGYGLSYTRFRFSKARVDRRTVSPDGAFTVTTKVRNTGKRAGRTVAQLYATSPTGAGTTTPRKRLVGFKKTRLLAPGRSQRVRIRVPVLPTFRLWDEARQASTVENGRWRLELGRSSRDVVKTLRLRVRGTVSQAVSHVTLQPEQLTLRPGETVDLRGRNPWLDGIQTDLREPATDVLMAARRDDTFVDLDGAPVTYASTRPDVLRVDPAGKVTARSPGVATVTATVGGRQGEAVFVVR